MFGWFKPRRDVIALREEPGLLRPGRRYRVVRAFVDHDGLPHPVGESWAFLRSNFLPYEDGLSLFVAMTTGIKRQIRLQWRPVAEEEIAAGLDNYLLPVADCPGEHALLLTRDSVAMGDDIYAPHPAPLDVAREADAIAVARAILAADYLAFAGSKATWSLALGRDRVLFGCRGGGTFVLPDAAGWSGVMAGEVDRLHVTYLAQEDPADILAVQAPTRTAGCP